MTEEQKIEKAAEIILDILATPIDELGSSPVDVRNARVATMLIVASLKAIVMVHDEKVGKLEARIRELEETITAEDVDLWNGSQTSADLPDTTGY